MQHQEQTMFESRLSRLEGQVSHIVESLDQMQQGMRGIQKAVQDTRQTNWPVLIGVGTLFLMILGGVFTALSSGYWRDQQRIDNALMELTRSFAVHVGDGHPRRVEEMIKANTASIKTLDGTLQREMRLLVGDVGSDLASLDTRIQNEMKLLASAQANALEDNQRRIDQIEDWILGRDKVVFGDAAKHEERFRAIERAVFKEESP